MTDCTTNETTVKLCECGCGQPAPIAKKTNTALGHVKGQPHRFISGHYGVNRNVPDAPNPTGLCMCGCGQVTGKSQANDFKRGHIKGEHYRYLPGHNPKIQPTPLADRFWAKVIKRGPDECWGWTGTVMPSGYGQIDKQNAHRVSYIVNFGPISEGMDVCHSCDDRYPPGDFSYRICVNPAHLWLGTRADNIQDMHRKGRCDHVDRRGLPKVDKKLTEDDIHQIRKMYDQGLRPIDIAAQFGITNSHVVGIGKRRSWTHIL